MPERQQKETPFAAGNVQSQKGHLSPLLSLCIQCDDVTINPFILFVLQSSIDDLSHIIDPLKLVAAELPDNLQEREKYYLYSEMILQLQMARDHLLRQQQQQQQQQQQSEKVSCLWNSTYNIIFPSRFNWLWEKLVWDDDNEEA